MTPAARTFKGSILLCPRGQIPRARRGQTHAPFPKRRNTGNSQKITDLFTTLCKSDLRVECVKEYRFHPERRWRFDYAIPSHKIALEVEGGVWTGGRHTSPKGFLGDIEKYNAATLLGWRVFRTTPDALLTSATLKLIRQAIQGDKTPQDGFFAPDK